MLCYYLSKLLRKLNILSQRPDYSNILHNNENMILIKLEYLVVCAIEGLAFKEEEYSLLIDIYLLQSQDLKVDQEKESYIRVYTRELDAVPSIE